MCKVEGVLFPGSDKNFIASAAEKAKSWVAQWTTHDWSLGGPSQFWVVRQWYTETIKSIKEFVKTSQSVFTPYSDTSTHRHTDGFMQDCSISGALATQILQSCAKPWIWYQCIYRVVCPIFFRNVFCKTQRMHWSPNRPSKVGPWVAHWIHGSHLATGRLCFISTALLTRPMMTLVGICPWNRVSTSAQLASAARVKCQMTTWSTGYLAPKAASTFSRCICLEEDTLTRIPPGWPPRCVHGIPAYCHSPWGKMQLGSVRALAWCSHW